MRVLVAVLSVSLITAVALALWPAGPHGERADRAYCLARLKSLTLATQLYAIGNDGRMPIGDWSSAIQPHVKSDLGPLRCPSLEHGSGYVMNGNLLGQKLSDDPELALLFEAPDTRPGATADRVSPIDRSRHDGRQFVGFADGHVKGFPAEKVAQIRTTP